ncbi:hypothetical protein BCR33DRAFT_716574 [Rhizoclosmatium globosum]|uniref:Transmembrane protein 107 n=1 Tax=Rhizoclosmatium globosum TaxID=329046 RepID=A0A1Y2CE18_9FUNG|nr:hypothetical protein BCR33DRAFT_716574 [Rhizoclosmatium globosum]|eukprot:ORY45289.1 hypothetical protein BCR33DRAFT_716574 [Rhizoclosmatium globosum]
MATIMVFFTKDGNIFRAMPLRDISQYSTSIPPLTWICFSSNSLPYITAHVAATISLAFFITEAWHYQIYWYIFTFCNALPEILELIMIAKRKILRL